MWFLCILFLYIFVFFSHALLLQKTVYGDGIFYYSWVRSIVINRDINFANEYAHFSVNAPITPKGLPGNKHPIGTPLFWLPWYAQARMVMQGRGYELPYQLTVSFVSVLAALSGLVLLYRLLTGLFGQTASLLAAVSVAAATNLLFYGAVDPVNSHAVSFFAATVFLSFLFSKNVPPFVTGCALGFAALVRPQDAALGLLALVIPKSFSVIPALGAGIQSKKVFIKFLLGALLSFSPQLLVWYALYGSPWTSPYLTSSESFTLWPQHFFDVLLSPVNGLFLWTPITALAVVGLLFWKNPLRVWLLAIFVAEVAIVGSWSIWWQGASYSGRMLVSVLPVLSFGLAAVYAKLIGFGLRWKQILLAIIGPLSIINALFIVRFLLQT